MPLPASYAFPAPRAGARLDRCAQRQVAPPDHAPGRAPISRPVHTGCSAKSAFTIRADVSKGEPLNAIALDAVIAEPVVGQVIAAGVVTVRGWAMGPGLVRLTAIDLPPDDGAHWLPARVTTHGESWTWTFWEVELELAPDPHTLVVRVADGSGMKQPVTVSDSWNVNRYTNNAWHRVSDCGEVRVPRPDAWRGNLRRPSAKDHIRGCRPSGRGSLSSEPGSNSTAVAHRSHRRPHRLDRRSRLRRAGYCPAATRGPPVCLGTGPLPRGRR